MTDKLSVAIAAGGTAGHVNPALALAEELDARGHKVRFFGETRRLEGKLVPQAGFDFFPVNVTGFDRARPWTLATALAHLVHEERRLARAFRADADLMPDVAVGFGAYVELPLMRAAARLGVPVVLHEQNSVPGLANKQTARSASLIAIAQPSVRATFEQRAGSSTRIEMTGNPVRRSVLAGDRARGRKALGVPEDATLLLVFGGSLGAHHLNQRMVELKDRLLGMEGVHVVHSTGADDFEWTRDQLALTEPEQKRYRVQAYIDGMGDMLAAADLVLSRSGASSVAEIAALAAPSVLVPYPLATADHQTTNARFLVDAGAAVMFADADIDGDAFADEVCGLIASPERRAAMRAAARDLAQDQAAARLADAIESLKR
ncbi:undecaprenyldiphospho-muramoylpentapeptide beta-N-acetylglucosaminyltransferase [Collinsella tanakaei]|uniref:undecaprenyldiphospho-muramoylpentapeptide beta-N-acetylglucosaminyltransferase n=1 Tax=Collinsella tanakaei TaxID=626935 RepID=UPI00195F031C|nr:undecaprenyldiphospho-muramoylpentapeptide beta-N-acetylglucosaminyltransferase [Collinsella tanakaei]MBM6778592.1 undecaprenyldiphospho-muramoylpentapeptide beta-N-acetylglucosaminyltransferase [Collinsella tanakaei]